MRINLSAQSFKDALPVIERLEAAGFEAYFVGGSVRDALIGRPQDDVDITTSATPQEIKTIFKKTVDVGIEHGTVLVLTSRGKFEVTTFRADGEYLDYRRPDSVTFVRSLEEDLKRRDFTVNAFALKANGEILDYFEGEKDLQEKRIRAVGNPQDRFNEDALRMIRAIRFVAQLGFDIEDETYQAICDLVSNLEKIAVERITVELSKMMQGHFWKKAMNLFIQSKMVEAVPKLTLNNLDIQALQALEGVHFTDLSQIFAVLLTSQKVDVKAVSPLLRKWKVSNEVLKRTQKITKAIQFRLEGSWTRHELYHLTLDEAILAEESLRFFGQKANVEKTVEMYQEMPIHNLKDLGITGVDILQETGESQGKWLGEMLQFLAVEVLNGNLPNNKEKLLIAVVENRNKFN
ncbi:MAG: CCA tRNA nucleotidyltransferase [Streptococcaceae bacterium]|jgi:tRNA nucleotidyltransferase (CCA-adding enzyme)|nr:CCA tRNA nucleotidyltransferase [Streptococcaceae bacterium]